MTQENRLRDEFAKILNKYDYALLVLDYSKVIPELLSAVRESLPKGQSVLPERLNSARFVMNGWNAYRKEMLKLLGAKDDGE